MYGWVNGPRRSGYNSGSTPLTCSITSAATNSEPVATINVSGPAIRYAASNAEATSPVTAATGTLSRLTAAAKSSGWTAFGCRDFVTTTRGSIAASSDTTAAMSCPVVPPTTSKTSSYASKWRRNVEHKARPESALCAPSASTSGGPASTTSARAGHTTADSPADTLSASRSNESRTSRAAMAVRAFSIWCSPSRGSSTSYVPRSVSKRTCCGFHPFNETSTTLTAVGASISRDPAAAAVCPMTRAASGC